MKIFLVSATSAEIEPFLHRASFRKKLASGKERFAYGKAIIDVLITGVGMVPTAFWMAKSLYKENYDVAINVGIAGSFSTGLQIGEIVNVVSDRFSEIGAESGEQFLSLIDLKLLEDDKAFATNNELVNSSVFESKTINSLKKVKGITVNTVHGCNDSIQKVRKLFHPDVESMEGAAFLYVCLNERIQCLQLRAISNYIETRNKEKWNIPLAIRNVNNALFMILDE
ncbi:MAG: futalosine hydrolase [Lentimicrobiaceae bacterium]|nr:futalosine hydrolase [Lentimicrobiaceae bacterium]